jgi:hypothetical protein
MYQMDKGDGTFMLSVTELIGFTKATLRVDLQYLYTDAGLSTLSQAPQDCLAKNEIDFENSSPYQHYKNDKA